MTRHELQGTLPIRRWLALALLVVFFVPLCVTVAFTAAWVGDRPTFEREQARDALADGAGRWTDPDWQAATTAHLARDNIAFVLNVGGEEIYRSTPDPYRGPDNSNHARVIERLEIPGSSPEQVAVFYTDPAQGPPEEIPIEFLPFVAVGALALTLIGITWFIGRTVLRPLAATATAAREVAGGNLDVSLPSSRVREVAELNATFETMSAALRSSLEQQAEMEQERRLLIGAVVHDLRTPLFSLRGYLEGLEKEIADTTAKRAHYVAVAQDKADELERLISDLFDYTRLEYLDQTPSREPVDLHTLLDKLVAGLTPQAAAKNVELVLDCATAPRTVSGDSHLLTRVVENLLDNALRHTPAGGRIVVECRTEGDRVVFTVHDSGPGIPADELPHVFAPLYRGESSRNRRTGGAGLGLTIARRIVHAHGGDLSAANHPAGGAVFTGWLPLDDGVQ